MENQLRFHSTKKKHIKPRLAKPNHEEVSKCIENFEDVEIEADMPTLTHLESFSLSHA